VRDKDVSVCGDARVEFRPLFPRGVAVCGIITGNRRTPDIETANSDAFIDQQNAIRDHLAESGVLAKCTVMVTGDDNLVAVRQFAEPVVEVLNLGHMVPEREVARMNQ
jgi:hypothetical protein